MEKNSRIWVDGRNTLIGSRLVHQLEKQGYKQVLDFDFDPFEPRQIQDLFLSAQPEYVFVAAGKWAGIKKNMDLPADLMIDNLLTGIHLIHNAHQFGVKKLLYLGSSCCFPKMRRNQ